MFKRISEKRGERERGRGVMCPQALYSLNNINLVFGYNFFIWSKGLETSSMELNKRQGRLKVIESCYIVSCI